MAVYTINQPPIPEDLIISAERALFNVSLLLKTNAQLFVALDLSESAGRHNEQASNQLLHPT